MKCKHKELVLCGFTPPHFSENDDALTGLMLNRDITLKFMETTYISILHIY